MRITTKEIQELRNKTGVGMMDCKKALEDSSGDIEKAVDCLRKKGATVAVKRAEKEAKEGVVAVYSHGGRIGAMVEVNCETDFVAKNEDFKNFVRDIAMQVAAAAPKYLSRSDVPKEISQKEREIETEKLRDEKKPKEIIEKIIEGKLDKFYAEVCLLEQTFIKDDKITISDLLNEKLASIGEKIEIRRFERFELGETE
jgi:elongation factor Ts